VNEIIPSPVRIIEGLPALAIGRRAVIGDLHIGYEISVSEKGMYLPSQVKRYIRLITELKERTRADELIILGDVKQSVGYPGIAEAKELIEFFREASLMFKITVVPGNHDGGLEGVVRDYARFALPDGILIEEDGLKLGLLHGHARPSKEVASADIVIMAHLHLFIKYEREKIPVWLVGNAENGKKLILAPPFNDLLPGHSLWSPGEKVPFFNIRYSDLAVITLEGFYLGRVREIKGLIEVEND